MCDKGFSEEEVPSDDRDDTYVQDIREDGGITTLEVIFEVLMRPRRRFILYYLHERKTATVDELARRIIAWEQGMPPDTVPDDASEQVATELVHHHLPKLAAAAFLEYDARSKTVRYDDPPDLLDAILGFLTTLEGKPNA